MPVPAEFVMDISCTVVIDNKGRNRVYLRTFEYGEYILNSRGMSFMDAEEETKLDVFFSSIQSSKQRQSSPKRSKAKGGKVIS